ncbi:MAG: 50S ribosomal protein L28 [Candidatus Kaiserbacteria bacterium]|nr:50S ribosomal protein L28 [Candidatus Kaiserbacteria bacterium]
MAKQCPITGKRPVVGGGYSNRTRATKFNPTGRTWKRTNLQKQTFIVNGKKVKVSITAKGLRSVKKHGAEKVLKMIGALRP